MRPQRRVAHSSGKSPLGPARVSSYAALRTSRAGRRRRLETARPVTAVAEEHTISTNDAAPTPDPPQPPRVLGVSPIAVAVPLSAATGAFGGEAALIPAVVFGGLPLLTVLLTAGVAVCSRKPARRRDAQEVLRILLGRPSHPPYTRGTRRRT
ncbi:hypothetical protein STAN_4199 [Streptomyces sp. CBMAI 2042]|nr:hypothetical protein STAN_4199 [Streptomyces sp. CBMAI 2042]